jgi:hypothetical protein
LRHGARRGIRRIMPGGDKPKSTTANFRSRYDELEARRDALIARLGALGERAAAHPSHRRARTMLNVSFRKASLVQRAAILEAADWMITILDRSITLL